MTECRLILAGAAIDAGARIGAVRDAHLALLRPMAEAGDLLLGLPLLDASGYRGSLMLVSAAALDRYLAAEPFRREGIWAWQEVHPFRIAPLPYRPLPSAGETPAGHTHVVSVAWDGTDEGAPARRLAVRERHLARVEPAARQGVLALGGAILDGPGGGMRGSVAVTAHPTVEAAQAWWAEDPYVTGGVWRDVTWYATRFAPLPYRPLPGTA
ncbi:Uncharacterized conserved protein YciI, contains a putative active-site phosphohistidine [Roseomonas rosea]|uniref:Uncharacterized conserved protein YciI, contains a putative active-site phosphohistidine n=1 Tax=Muricoccus roseus TaxID=198092 RepID=A0A1M6FPT5_9PROT|nr:YciI family protein [Roseomonas rosea]SHI99707.1 Uncharacterized conserved protein YciI, contains a putative active-site phosphohistidine [Roseomonas rosea]